MELEEASGENKINARKKEMSTIVRASAN